MNRSFHIGVQVYISRNNVNVRSETLLSENSHHVVTSQLIYIANELTGFHSEKPPLKSASETDVSEITQALQVILNVQRRFHFLCKECLSYFSSTGIVPITFSEYSEIIFQNRIMSTFH